MMICEIDGEKLYTIADFHKEFATNPSVPDFHGHNWV